MSRTSRRLLAAAIGFGICLVAAPAAPAAAAPARAACALTWGSTPEANGTYNTAPVTDVRAGRHECYDRLVIDLRGATGYDVRYVSRVTEPGTGDPVPLRGGARLQINVNAPTYDTAGRPVYNPPNPRELANVGAYSTFRQVALAGSFEGVTNLGLGVRARLPFRVLTLGGSSPRLVVDVAHHW